MRTINIPTFQLRSRLRNPTHQQIRYHRHHQPPTHRLLTKFSQATHIQYPSKGTPRRRIHRPFLTHLHSNIRNLNQLIRRRRSLISQRLSSRAIQVLLITMNSSIQVTINKTSRHLLRHLHTPHYPRRNPATNTIRKRNLPRTIRNSTKYLPKRLITSTNSRLRNQHQNSQNTVSTTRHQNFLSIRPNRMSRPAKNTQEYNKARLRNSTSQLIKSSHIQINSRSHRKGQHNTSRIPRMSTHTPGTVLQVNMITLMRSRPPPNSNQQPQRLIRTNTRRHTKGQMPKGTRNSLINLSNTPRRTYANSHPHVNRNMSPQHPRTHLNVTRRVHPSQLILPPHHSRVQNHVSP